MRLQLEDLLVRAVRVLEPLGELERVAQVVPGEQVVRLARDRLLVPVDRRRGVAGLVRQVAQVVQRDRVAWRHREQSLVRGDGVVHACAGPVGQRQVEERARIGRPVLGQDLELADRFVEEPCTVERDGQAPAQLVVVRIGLDLRPQILDLPAGLGRRRCRRPGAGVDSPAAAGKAASTRSSVAGTQWFERMLGPDNLPEAPSANQVVDSLPGPG